MRAVGLRAVSVSEFRCEAWTAVHDRVEGKENALTVTGVCHTPQPGWSFALLRADDQGADPHELRLRLEARRPEDGPARRSEETIEFVTYVDDPVQRVSIEGVAEGIPVDVVA
jgi:hypothetical protein